MDENQLVFSASSLQLMAKHMEHKTQKGLKKTCRIVSEPMGSLSLLYSKSIQSLCDAGSCWPVNSEAD